MLEAMLWGAAIVAGIFLAAAVWDEMDRQAQAEKITVAAAQSGADFGLMTRGTGRTVIAIDQFEGLLAAAGPVVDEAVVFRAGQIIGVEVSTDVLDIAPPKRKSVLGRAVLGGALLGGAGAAVGAASGLGGTDARTMRVYYLNIFTDHPGLPHHAVMFSRQGDAQHWRGLILAMERTTAQGKGNV